MPGCGSRGSRSRRPAAARSTGLQRSAAESVATVCTGGLPGSLANPEVLRRLGRFEQWQPAECMRWQLRRMERLADGDA